MMRVYQFENECIPDALYYAYTFLLAVILSLDLDCQRIVIPGAPAKQVASIFRDSHKLHKHHVNSITAAG